jgi:hypothetical protein
MLGSLGICIVPLACGDICGGAAGAAPGRIACITSSEIFAVACSSPSSFAPGIDGPAASNPPCDRGERVTGSRSATDANGARGEASTGASLREAGACTEGNAELD